MVRVFAWSVLSLLCACTPPDCTRWSEPKQLGTFADTLSELSGLVASRSQPGVLYAHNDSGDSARFFATTTTGKLITEFLVDGATNVDWEDLALGPCPAGTCLFIADSGDNAGTRTDLALYRLTEPTGLLAAGVSPKKSIASERIRFEYPATRYDAEALFVHPVTGRVYLVTKEGQGERSHLFRFPATLDPGTTATLEEVGKLSVPTDTQPPVTAADISPSGQSVLIRMGLVTVQYAVPTGTFEDFRTSAFTLVPTAVEPQGEAVAFLADGKSIVTSTESTAGGPPLDGVTCAE